jgi:hypothetical protein
VLAMSSGCVEVRRCGATWRSISVFTAPGQSHWCGRRA